MRAVLFCATACAMLRRSPAVWLPVHPPDAESFFYNPVTGKSSYSIPSDVLAVHQGAELLQVASGNASNSTDGASQAVPTLVPVAHRKSCVPHCTWKCTNPVCEQECKPRCAVPRCETRCPKLPPETYKTCHVECNQPNCAMYCPQGDQCNGTKTLDCNNPNCVTRCAKPKCQLNCPHLGCETVCPQPACEWACKKPKSCPTPKCSMVCEQAPECGQAATIDSPDGEKVAEKRAVMRTARWVVGPWAACSNSCGSGVRTRRVKCNSGVDADCPGKQPASSERCSSTHGCRYHTGEWGTCSSRCGQGTKTREVACSGAKCDGHVPPSERSCVGRDSACEECRVTVYGSRDFGAKAGDWKLEFTEGEYSAAELEYRGAKCDDISSLEVVGVFCEMEAFEYGDFNQAHSGWNAHFSEGKYDLAEMEARGAKNNDMSSFKVVLNHPQETETTATSTSAPTAKKHHARVKTIPGADGSPNRPWNAGASNLLVVFPMVVAWLL